MVLELAEMTGGLMEGILGMDLFRGVLLTLDPSSSRAIVALGALEPGASGVIAFDAAGGRMSFPIDVAGKTIDAQIDHGSPSAFTLGIDYIDFCSNGGRIGD